MKQGGKRINKEGNPFVSIITVVYNSEALIERTINSVVEQLCTDYEFLIFDGGSSDNTINLLSKYEESINYWISEPDRGIYDAMNKGLKKAKGDYVWFVNSGDELESPETIKRIKMKQQGADVYFGETNFVDINRIVVGTRSEISTRKLPESLTWESMKVGMVVSHQSILVKRNLAGPFNINYKCSADIDWVIDALKKSTIIINTGMILSKYLIGGFSIKNVKRCWKERYQIYVKHYGPISTFFIHMGIIFRAIIHKMGGKSNY